MNARILAAIGLLLLVASPSPAPLVCYDDGLMPGVTGIAKDADSIVVTLGGGLLPDAHPRFRWRAGVWEHVGNAPVEERGERCPVALLARNWAEVTDFANMHPTVHCARDGGDVYGGVEFYDGEGYTGRGALLRLHAGTVERRLPRELAGRSVSAVAARDGVVWFGTVSNGECSGHPFEHGLVRYDWTTRALTTFEGKDDGPLGFVVNALLIDGGFLWVGTDLGLSRLDLASRRWTHWIASGGAAPSGMRSVEPAELFRDLLATTPKQRLMTDTYDNQLEEGLAAFRPKLLHAWISKTPPQTWDCPAARFEASQQKSFVAFRDHVAANLTGDPLVCAVDGFAATGNHETAWRDWVIELGATTRVAPSTLRWFRGDAVVEKYLLAHLDDEAVTILPLVSGPKSVPLLRDELDRRLQNRRSVKPVIYALELATHRRMSLSGDVAVLPEGSDRPAYADAVPYRRRAREWSTLEPRELARLANLWRAAIDEGKIGD